MPSNGFSDLLTTRHYKKPAYFQRAIGSNIFEKIFGYLLSDANSFQSATDQIRALSSFVILISRSPLGIKRTVSTFWLRVSISFCNSPVLLSHMLTCPLA